MKNKPIIILMFIAISYLGAQRYNGELYVRQDGGTSRTWVVEDQSTIYGLYSSGYPIKTSGYDYKTATGYSILCRFGEGQDIYYALYKVSVNGDYYVC